MTIGAALRRFGHVSGKLDMTRPYIVMFDDVTVAVLPSGATYAYAGYVGGLWPTFTELKARFPKNRLLSVAVNAAEDAECLDIENGDATIADAPGWYERQVARGVYRPVLYIEASRMRALEQVMATAHVERSAYRLWIAHYTDRAHLCSPSACGYGMSEADASQFTQVAYGRNLDQSLLLPNFFDPRPAPPVPHPVDPPKPTPVPEPVKPTWQEAMMNALPTLQQGDHDEAVAYVGRMQALIQLVGERNHLEKASAQHTTGVFDDMTKAALEEVQDFFKVTADGVCGPKTWPALVTGAP